MMTIERGDNGTGVISTGGQRSRRGHGVIHTGGQRSRRRVVITGVGVVSPLGSSLDSIAAFIASGNSAIGPLSLFDGEGLTSTAVGEIPDFPIERWRETRRFLSADFDRKVFFALAAGRDAVASAGLSERPDLCSRMGLVVGTSLESFLIEQLLEHSPGTFEISRFIEGWLAHRSRGAGRAHCSGGGGVAHRSGGGLAHCSSGGGVEHHSGGALAHSSGHGQLLQTPLDRSGQILAEEVGIEAAVWTNCSACAAGTQALGQGLRLVREGRLELALAGGTDSMLNPLGLGGFSVLGALAPAGRDPSCACRPFDRSRAGTVLGEGAAFFVIESLDHALSRQAHPLAELLGYGASLDAHRVSDPCPDGRGAAHAMLKAMNDAGLDADDIEYVSAHGTGTIKNDPMESTALIDVLGSERAHSIPVSSLKSVMGHLIGASGPVELAAVLAALKHDIIPATLHLTHPDPECPLDYVPLKPRRGRIGTFLKNSFGLGGQNSTLAVRLWEDDSCPKNGKSVF